MSWEEKVRRVVPYVAGEQPGKPGVIKLNTNECPYPPAPGVKRLAEELDCGKLRLYPDPDAAGLTEALAEYYQVRPEQVFVGVGSDDVLAMAFLTFFNSGKPVLFPDVTYSFYDVWAQLFRIPYQVCPLDESWRIRPEDYRKENGGVIFPNPNAPTGMYETLETVERILEANRDVVVIVDEAYIDFGGHSALPLLEKYDNLLIVQTFSKSRAMAGLRIGFCIGSEKLIGYLKDVKFSFNSYTMNLPAQLLGREAIRDDAYFKKTVAKIVATRQRVKKELKSLGFSFPDSRANFLFVTHDRIPARQLFSALREADIYVRYWDKPRISDYLRITVGTDEEMDALLAFLKDYVSKADGKWPESQGI
ncbi:MAG: histidinol-phosphate transaminase [Roseburia sp.]|nr:histidinol-phosphate transaminase [Roseburia sp.]MCM1098935.1 histidinol-phosphate transaminase [Ruminococcus flavefaciens]